MERAKSIDHAEFALLNHLLDTVDLYSLEQRMVPDGDAHAKKRFDKACEKVCGLLENMADRRRHKLPADHPHYKAKED